MHSAESEGIRIAVYRMVLTREQDCPGMGSLHQRDHQLHESALARITLRPSLHQHMSTTKPIWHPSLTASMTLWGISVAMPPVSRIHVPPQLHGVDSLHTRLQTLANAAEGQW
jgi:hypothetical protein